MCQRLKRGLLGLCFGLGDLWETPRITGTSSIRRDKEASVLFWRHWGTSQ